MQNIDQINLTYDAVHGYIPFTSNAGLPPGEVSERMLIDSPWIQRLRQIHQLQTAWWVYPTAEHTRFQHVLGAMHLASKTINLLYDSLVESLPAESVPSRGYVESLCRIAALLHDVGHGPFGHFFDRHYLADYAYEGQRLNHEVLGGIIIREKLSELITGIRRTPTNELLPDERIDPNQVAYLIKRPPQTESADVPQWLRFLRSLFCGLYTVDNMDFVLRDAFMSGLNNRSIDVDRLLHYTRFSPRGLTIHDKGLSAVLQFISARAELFRTVYFHRTVRAIDLELRDFFDQYKCYLFNGNPAENLEDYLYFTEFSLMSMVNQWRNSDDAKLQQGFQMWNQLTSRQLQWRLICHHTISFQAGKEKQSILGDEQMFELRFRQLLPEPLRDMKLQFDSARHVCRPDSLEPSRLQNFLYNSATGKISDLETEDLYRQIPQTFRIYRVFARDEQYAKELTHAMNQLFGNAGTLDDDTNM